MLENFSMIIKYTHVSNISEISSSDLIKQLDDVFFDISEFTISEDNNRLSKLAECYYEVGNWEKAIQLYKNSLNQNSEKASTHYGIALCYFMLNDNETALSHLLLSFQLNPGTEISFLDDFPFFESTQLYINLTESL